MIIMKSFGKMENIFILLYNTKTRMEKYLQKENCISKKSATRADFKLEDFRDGYIEGAEVTGNQIKFVYRKNEKEDIKKQ